MQQLSINVTSDDNPPAMSVDCGGPVLSKVHNGAEVVRNIFGSLLFGLQRLMQVNECMAWVTEKMQFVNSAKRSFQLALYGDPYTVRVVNMKNELHKQKLFIPS